MQLLFVDFECAMSPTVNLKRLTLRQYLSQTWITGVAWALDDEPAQYLGASKRTPLPAEFVAWLQAACADPEVVVVAHNAAFDVRVMRFLLDCPQPARVHCTLEMACCAFPNQPGGYKLGALAKTLGLGSEKLEVDISALSKAIEKDGPAGEHARATLEAYCTRDVELCRSLYRLCRPRVPDQEIRIGELANQLRELHLEVDTPKVHAAVEEFSRIASTSAIEALVGAGADGEDEPFGWTREPGTLGEDDPGRVRSVKPEKLKRMLLDRLAFDVQSITIKKINPAHLAANPEAAGVLRSTQRANKALSHQRRAGVFHDATVVDMELGWFRAHTGRYSSPSSGKGINLHNLPKRDKVVAKAIRSLFRLPEGYCFVRADLANVEYRVEGWLTKCRYVSEMFEANVLADPYAAFGRAATGMIVTKKDPARQVFKGSVLGLGFAMGIGRWISELLLLLADSANGVTVADLRALCAAQKWAPTTDPRAKAQATKLHAPWEVATVAKHTRDSFHALHPEFFELARWLLWTCQKVSAAADPTRALDQCHAASNAPAPSRLYLSLDPGLSGRSIRAHCGDWSRTVAWRDLGIHATKFGPALSCVQAGNKGFRAITPSIVIENVTQSAARNALVKAKLELERRGWPYLLSVHDELMIVCPQDRASILRARRDLLDVVGPGNQLGYGWAVVVDPAEINVSRSLFETELGMDWWNALEAGDENRVLTLPS